MVLIGYVFPTSDKTSIFLSYISSDLYNSTEKQSHEENCSSSKARTLPQWQFSNSMMQFVLILLMVHSKPER